MDELPESELEKAASAGELHRLKDIIRASGLSASSDEATRAVCTAAECSHWDCVQYLVQEATVDVQPDACGGLLLQHAAVAGRLDMLDMLLGHGASLRLRVGAGVLLSSAATGNMEVLKLAVDRGADVYSFGGEAAWSAAKASSWEAVAFLVRSGINLEEDGLGVRLLSQAAVNEQPDAVKLLQERGVEIMSPTGALALASMASTHQWDTCAEAVKYLLDAGVDVQARGAGQAALVTAATVGDLEVVKRLVTSGVDVTGEAGSRAMDRAGELGPPESAKAVSEYLAQCGAVAPKVPELVLDEDF